MAESTSRKVTLRYPVSINGVDYPANISLDLPTDIASEAERLSNGRLEQELKRMQNRPDEVKYLGSVQ